MIKLIRILLSILLLVLSFIFPKISLVFYISSYVIASYDIIIKAIKNIFNKEFFDENFLMSIATIGAFFINEYLEAVAVMIFYQIGEYFQDKAVQKSRKSIVELMDLRPDTACLVTDNNEYKTVSPNEIKINDLIYVKPGEKIPLDGIIVKGNTTLDTKNLTGESMPRETNINDEVLSGMINISSPITIKVRKLFTESTASKIIEMVEDATMNKAKSENFITKFAKIYTPIVVLLAVILAFVPPLFLGFSENFSTWLYRALSFLIISCPCALVLSIPLSFFAGIGKSAKNNILIKGSNYLELLSKTKYVVLDKTGTITKGNFEIKEINPFNIEEKKLLEYACLMEKNSNHPIAKAILKYQNNNNNTNASSTSNTVITTELSGLGLKGEYNNETILCGNSALMEKFNIKYVKTNTLGTIIYLAKNNTFLGSIVISDTIKETSKKAISNLNSINIETIMLTGDNEEFAKEIASSVGIKEYHSSLLPDQKVELMKSIMNKKSEEETALFVGDGINDAPVLAISDIGISMGEIGSDAAIEASDIVLMTDDLLKIKEAIDISKEAMRKVKQNIMLSLGVKLVVLILAIFGYMSMWLAVIADVGVCLVAIINAISILNTKNKNEK